MSYLDRYRYTFKNNMNCLIKQNISQPTCSCWICEFLRDHEFYQEEKQKMDAKHYSEMKLCYATIHCIQII